MKKSIRVLALSLTLAAAVAGGAAFAAHRYNMAEKQAVYGLAEEAAVLKQGCTGSEVRTVQTKLKRWGYYDGAIDGIYGSRTKKAVIYFQKKNGLTADGIVGKKTFAALGMMNEANGGSSGSSGTSSGANGYTSSDVYLLQYHIGRHLSEGRIHCGRRRADQPYAQSDRHQCGERRDERLGSDLRLPVLL